MIQFEKFPFCPNNYICTLHMYIAHYRIFLEDIYLGEIWIFGEIFKQELSEKKNEET